MEGVIKPDGYYLCQQDRTSELNERIFSRTQSNRVPNVYFSPRPVSTKYSIMPISDPEVESTVRIELRQPYNTTSSYLTGASVNGGAGGKGPWDGFAHNVNDESVLQNRFVALTKCQQGVYIPNEKSDLYEGKNLVVNNNAPKHGLLFEGGSLKTKNYNCLPDTKKIFNNNTRPKTWTKQDIL